MVRDVSEDTRLKWKRIVKGLCYSTEQKKIVWNRTAAETAFLTNLNKFIILFQKEEYEDTGKIYTIKVQNEFGELLDEFDDEDLDNGKGDMEFFILLDNLYLKVLRQLSGAEAAIDQVLEALESLQDDF